MLKRAYIFAVLAVAWAGWAGAAWAGGGTRGGGGRAGTAPAATRAATIPATAGRTGTGPATATGRADGATIRETITMQLPRGWAEEGGANLIVARAPGADRDSTGPYQATLSVSRDAGNQVDGAAQQAAMAKALQGYEVMEPPTAVRIGGLQGVMFGGSFKDRNVELRCRQYMFAANNQVYTITFTCLNSKWAGYQGVVEGSVGTFGLRK
jgi:hypothetical protein